MFKYTVLVLCSQVFFVLATGNLYGSNQCCCGQLGTANAGRSFEVVSASEPPTGLAVLSENVYEGNLNLGGQLPFLGTAAVAGCVPSEGCSKVCYGCGNQVSLEGERGCAGAAGLRGCGCGCGSNNYGWSVSL